ncbi:MAG: purine-nucleoside phosphorylase [Pyrinomonadaceae bacterium]
MSYENAVEAAEYIRSKYPRQLKIAVVLGSGLGMFADVLSDAVRIPYEEIPHFVKTTVAGHSGQLVLGEIDGKSIAVQQGRFHYYEGYSMDQVMFPVRVFGRLGVENLILTNAADSLNTDMRPGELMLISDHINCLGVNPLRGTNDDRFGPRFPDMSSVYDDKLQTIAHEAAEALSDERFDTGFDVHRRDLLRRGIYCALSGPTYETPAEIRMYRLLGADAVGMSTVPEAIAARHMGIKVLGISCITNMAAGMEAGEIDHSHVMETGVQVADIFRELIKRIIKKINS